MIAFRDVLGFQALMTAKVLKRILIFKIMLVFCLILIILKFGGLYIQITVIPKFC